MPHMLPPKTFLLKVVVICGVIMGAAISKRVYDAHRGVDPAWGITKRGVDPGWKMNP